MNEKKIILQHEQQEGEGGQYAYIFLKEDLKNSEAGESKRQVTYDGYGSEEAKKEGLEFIVDFDENDKIIGIEIISNKDIIPDSLK